MPGKRGKPISKHEENLTDFGELFGQLCDYLDVKDADIARLSGLSKAAISKGTHTSKGTSIRQPSRSTVIAIYAAFEQIAEEKDLPLTQGLKDIFFNLAPSMHATPEQAANAKSRMGMVYRMLEEARKHAREEANGSPNDNEINRQL